MKERMNESFTHLPPYYLAQIDEHTGWAAK